MTLGNARRSGRVASVLAVCLLAISMSGCTTTTQDGTGTPLGDVTRDQEAKLFVSPVDYGNVRVVTAQFGAPLDDRPVSLQRKIAAGWEEVSTGKQNKAGVANFQLKLDSENNYRAVALETTGSGGLVHPAAATPEASASLQWKPALSTDFDGNVLDAASWNFRSTGAYDSGGRQCSAPYPANVKIAGGKAALSVTKETDPANIVKSTAAGCKESGQYSNAMISTQGKFTVKTGIVATRVKFPLGQGMHGSVWLQSLGKSEIDFIESFGYGRGLTSVIHVDGQRYPVKSADIYVNDDAAKDRDWWSQYHVYSVEWDRQELVFRIDGAETQRIKKALPEIDYFLILSMLSSDWEQKRFTDPVKNAEGVTPTELPQTMSVDWVKVWTPA